MGNPCKYGDAGPGSWDPGPFLRYGGSVMSDAERALLRSRSPAVRADPPPQPVCRMFDRCEGCPYPAHGFICWGPDEKCLRSEMEKICAQKEMMTQ